MVGVIDKVSGVCFGVEVTGRDGLHWGLVGGLEKLFAEGGYRVYLEYPVCFESKVRKSRLRRVNMCKKFVLKLGGRLRLNLILVFI